jgi:succinyl-diaminopimelate desuccinylase
LQVVFVEGGVAANVVPDVATITLNHRVAPDRSHDEAVAWLRSYLGELIERGDEFTVVDWAPSARPMLSNERLDALVALTGTPAVGKWGWTDVATFQELGIPATNFGAGDPLLAHRSDEKITGDELALFERVLRAWLT